MTEEAGRGRVIGLGGLFMLSADPAVTLAWYRDVLGMRPNDYDGFDFLHADSARRYPTAARSILAAFNATSEYFRPSALPFMINLMVDDLSAVLVRAEAAGADQLQPREDTDYGNFAWLMDPDGRKIELWEPREPTSAED